VPTRICFAIIGSIAWSSSGFCADIASSSGTSRWLAYAVRAPPPVGFTWQSAHFCS
jgi:hypothetical protein